LIVIDPPEVVFAPLDASVHETVELGVAVIDKVLDNVASIVCVDADAGIANAPITSATIPTVRSFFIERASLDTCCAEPSLDPVFNRFGGARDQLDS
jgi:hypothetical protein